MNKQAGKIARRRGNAEKKNNELDLSAPLRLCAGFFCLIAVLSLPAGCSTLRPDPPGGWSELQPGSGAATLQAAMTRNAQPGKLQIIVCYDQVLNTHAAVRLEMPDRSAVYWDPGGAFAQGDVTHYLRKRDVIANPTPSLQEIWQHRSNSLGNKEMAVFEWDLPPSRVQELMQSLLDGSEGKNTPNAYDPNCRPADCAVTVCDFIQKRADDIVKLSWKWRYPHEIGEHLWSQNPARVLIYDRSRKIRTLIRQ